MRTAVAVFVVCVACMAAAAVVSASPPCWTRSGQWNSDGGGMEYDTHRAFSTSQNVAWDYETPGVMRSRYQITKWYLPGTGSPLSYNQTRHNYLLAYDESEGPIRYEFDEVNGNVVNCVRYTDQEWLDASCVPSDWVPWNGDDTHQIGNVNITTWCPPSEQNEFLPDHSLLVMNSESVLAQLRVRQNGHYLLMLSVENWVGGYRLNLTTPDACANAPTLPQPSPAPFTFFVPFWTPVYPTSDKDGARL